ncbi:MAG: hypothetical protein M3277_03380 [Actinomycetota bacterium]|nr:hypothetical protein [Actinomycetota bacterium]
MKRFLIVLMVLGLLVGTVVTAEAKGTKRVERTVEGSYGPYPAPATGCNDVWTSFACMVVSTRTTEAFFTAKVTDAHGQPVFVQVGSSGGGTLGTFCGETTEPIGFYPGTELYFYVAQPVWPYPDDVLDCPAHRIKTTGTISVTLSNQGPEPIQGPEANQGPEPMRSGSILSGTGWFLDYQRGGCQVSPECAAWLQYDCTDALIGHDPGLTASIVDVDELADGPPIERIFRFGSGEAGLVWGGVHLQFWSSDCVEIPQARIIRSVACDGYASGRDCWSIRFRMPPTAKWMTVTGYQDNVNLAWSLT